MNLTLIAETFAVCKLKPDQALPSWLNYSGYSFVARTPDELSIICPERMALQDAQTETGLRCLKIEKNTQSSRIARVTLGALLSKLGLEVIAVSTFESDYLFFQNTHSIMIRQALEREGYEWSGATH